MNTVKIPDGQYVGKIIDCGLINTKSGKQMAFMKIEFPLNPALITDLTWYGSLASDKSKAYVKKKFQNLSPSISTFSDIAESLGKKIKKGLEVRISVKNEPNQKDPTLIEPKIKYIDPAGKFKKISAADAAHLDEDCPF